MWQMKIALDALAKLFLLAIVGIREADPGFRAP